MTTKIKVSKKGLSVLDGNLTTDDMHNLLKDGIIMPIIPTGQGELFLVSTPKGKWKDVSVFNGRRLEVEKADA